MILKTPRSAKAGLLTDQGNNWQAIVNHLNDLLKTLQENCVSVNVHIGIAFGYVVC